MSLSKDALDTLTATAIAASGAPLDTEVPAILVPDGYHIENIEHLQARPSAFRGDFRTPSISAFAGYVQRHAIHDQSAGFIHLQNMSAEVLFDLGTALTPGFGAHTAQLYLLKTAPYSAVCETAGKALHQQDLIDFLEDWNAHIEGLDSSGEPISLPAVLHAIRHMRIESKTARESEIGDFNRTRSAMEDIEAKSTGTLPRMLVFACTPYEHLAPITICLRISVLTGRSGQDGPVFRLHWLNNDRQMEDIANDFRDVLSEEMAGAVPLTIGTFTRDL